MARKRNKIRYCYNDYMTHISEEDRTAYRLKYQPLVEIIDRVEDDREIMDLAKEYDGGNGTDMFGEALHLMVYCIACHKMDCDC